MSYSADVLAFSPLGYYRLGDAGTTMADSSGNARDGSYIGTSSATTGLVSGDSNGARSFAGGRGSVTDAAWMDATSFTALATIKPTGVSGTQTIVARYDGFSGSTFAPSSFALRLEGNKLSCHIFVGNTPGNALGTTSLVAGTTYDVAATYDGTTVKIYVNGVLDGSASRAGMNNASTPLTIGSTSTATETFTGVIDDVAFIGTVLTAANLGALSTTRSTGGSSGAAGTVTATPSAPTVSISGTAPAPTGIAALSPQGRWRADRITGKVDGDTVTSWADDSGNGWAATNGSANALYKTAQAPTGLPVVRFSTTGLNSGANASATTQTIAAVVRVSGTSGYRTIVGANSSGSGLQIRIDNGTNKVVVNQSHVASVATSTGALTVGTFALVVFTYTVGGSWAIRINGAADSSGTSSASFGAATRQIGNDQGDVFIGDMAEIVTWERVLSGSEITTVESELTTRWLSTSTTGTVNATASAPTVLVSGTVPTVVTGTVTATASAPTVAIAGNAPIVGTVTASASAPTVLVSGNVAGITSGTVQATASAPTVSISGTIPTVITGTVNATASAPSVKVNDAVGQLLSGGFSFGSSLTSGAISLADQTLSGGFSFGSTLASLDVAVQQLEGGFSFGGRLTQQRDWGIPAGYTRPTPSVVIAHRDGTPVTNLPEVQIGELTSAVGALDSWQFSVDRDNVEGKKVDPVALEAHLYRGSVLMSKGPIGPGRLNDGRMVYDCSDPRWYLWDGRRIDRRPRLNWVYNGDFRLGTAGWTGGYEPGSIPEAVPVFSVVDEPESTSGKGLKIGGVDKVVTSVTDVETAAVFVPNSSAYLSGGEAILISAANSIPDGSNINIVGHTADRRAYGDPGNGLALSLARAQAARSTLHAHNATWTFSLLPGLLSPNMNDGVVAGRGYYEQVASNSTEASSAKNRRVALHYSSTQTASGHKQFVYQRKLGVVNTSKVELPVIISGRMTIGEWLGAPANNYALWAQVYDSTGKAIGAASGSVEPATATMYEQTPREAFRDYDVTVNIPPTNGQTYWIEYRLFPPAGWAVWTDIEVTPDEQLEFFGVDQALIIRDLVAFAQNPAYGHGPMGIGSRTPLTGVTRTKEYKFSAHWPVGTVIEELTSYAHGPEVDCEMTANTATVVTHYPRQGTIASFSLAHGGPRSIVKAYQPLPANTRTLASSVVVQAWGISNNRYERFLKDDAALGGTLLETVIDADAATPVNELAEVARQSLARSIHPLAAWEVTLDPARTSEVLDEIGKGDVVMLSLPDENVHALHRVVTIVWDPETDTLTLQLAPEEA